MAARGLKAFALFAAALGVLSLIGFWPPYFSKAMSVVDVRLHAHVVFVVLWMAALIGQPVLIQQRRFALHRAIGRVSFVLAPLVVVSALLLSHARLSAVPAADFDSAARFFYLPMQAVFAFSVSYGAAIIFRRRRAAHAAFMLGTALSLVDPIAARLILFYTHLPDDHWLYDYIAFALCGPLLGMLIVLSKDRAAQLAFGCLLAMFALIQLGWLTLSMTPAWRMFAAWFAAAPLS